MNLGYPNPSNATLLIDPIPAALPPQPKPLEIIAQPYHTLRLRYRTDFKTNQNRRGVLQSQDNPNYKSPAIRISQEYLSFTRQYVIRVCLVTIEHERTKCRYVHPYDLEDIKHETYNDKHNKAIWFPIQEGDIGGIKSFSNLRIVRKKADELKIYGDLHVFDSPTKDSTPQLSSVKDTVREFNLDNAQLAFTIAEKTIGNDGITMTLFSTTTVFSDILIGHVRKELESEDAPSESTTVRSHASRSSNCQVYKYAPRSVYQNSNDEVLIFYTSKLKPKKYGELQVRFEYQTPDGYWSQPALNLEVKDQMVSFQTPTFPFLIDNVTPVNIILRQKKRALEPLIFNYVPTAQCPNCQGIAMRNLYPAVETNPNKRPRLDLYADDDESDSMIPVCENSSEILESNSQTEQSSFPITSILDRL